jgi:hypothetical protein
VQVGLVRFGRGEEVEEVLQAVLDGPEVRAIAPALADVEGRLAKAALLRVHLAHVGEVIDPALLGARADVEIHALDRLVGAGRVLATLEDVMHAGQIDLLAAEEDRRRVVVAGARTASTCPCGRARTSTWPRPSRRRRSGLAPLGHRLALEHRALGHVDQGVDGAGVVDLVVRDGRGVGDARAGVGEHLVLEGALGMPEPSSSDMRVYWLPIRPLMFSHLGCAGSAGGLSGSKAMWQEPQEVPIRKGGSTEASASLLTRLSDSMPVTLSISGG